MSKVALRLYNREIETLIDQGHVDEAVAHCQHILKTYPKHLETYRLLGKAQLELRRYPDAADVFQRVLLAVPDDFVSHLGMSIVSDEQKDLDGAIWHMERAFEISSTNAGVQGELRRLRGRRDGLEPPKIQLTRGALAQIYTKGGEYQQALTEIRAVLAEDETRSDLKTLLARVYFRAGMRNEAIEACIDLLKQYPYSLEGNRILVEILPGTSMAQGVDQYKHRIEALDPYFAFVTSGIYETEGIPDNAVVVERYEWDPQAQSSGSWKMPATPEAPAVVEPAAPAEEIPAWMQQSGWGQSTGEFKDGPVNFDEPEPAAPATSQLAAAEIPDWLKAMAPPGAAAETPAEPVAANAAEDADFDWLAGLGAPPAASAPEPAPAETPSPLAAGLENLDGDLDWLNNLTPAAAPAAGLGLAADGGLDWLNNLTPPEASAEPAQPAAASLATEEPLPDWLTAGATPPVSPPAASWEPEPFPAAEVSPSEPSPAEIPAQSAPVADWLKDLAGEGAGQPLSDLVSGPGTSEAEQDESLKWLESLAEKQGAKAEELITNPAERFEAVPEWVNRVEDLPAEPKVELPAAYVPEKPIEVEAEALEGELSPVISGPGTSAEEQDDAFKWLESLAAGQGAKAEELLTQPAERHEQAPGWVGEVVSPPTELSGLVSGPGTSASEQDDALLWLESLAQKQGANPEELITKPEDRIEAAPEWVSQVGQVPETVEPPAPEVPAPKPPSRGDEEFVPGPLSDLISGPGTSASEQDDALLWLESLAQKQGANPEELITKPEDRIEAAPEWVSLVGQVPETVESPAPEVPAPKPPARGDEEFVPGPLSDLISGPGTSASEQDDALLWLESLAQKQGANPEELITKPEDRIEAAPEWVSQVGQVPETVEPPAPEVPAPKPPARGDEEFVPGPLSDLISGPGTSVSEQDDALLWLESLAQKQGANPEELITKPEDRIEAAPEWVARVGQEPVEPVPAEAPGDEALAWLAGLTAGEAAANLEAPVEENLLVDGHAASLEPEASLDWLNNLAAEPEVSQPPAASAEVEVQPSADEGLPDWLSGIGEPEAPVTAEEPAAWSVPVEAAEAEVQEPAAETIPDWLSGLGEPEAPVTTEEPAAWSAPVEAAEAEVQEPAAETIPDWLSGLGEPETPVATEEPAAWSAPVEAAEAAVQEPAAETIPDWLSGLGEPETPVTTEEPAAWSAPVEAVEAEVQEPAAETIPDWLSGLSEPEAPVTAEEPAAWQPVAEAESQPPAVESVPDWLASLDEKPESTETLPWEQAVQPEVPPVEVAPEAPLSALESEVEEPVSEVSAWLESLAESEQAAPAAESTPVSADEDLPAWLKDSSADEQAPAPEAVPGWVAVEEPAPVAEAQVEAPVAEIPAPVVPQPPVVAPQRPVLRQTGMLGGDKDAMAVQRARAALSHGGLDAAMGEYLKLIKKNKLIEEVIYDLQEAVYSHPVDVIVWQTLGDAYMRSNRLQEALNAYNKAEELLR